MMQKRLLNASINRPNPAFLNTNNCIVAYQEVQKTIIPTIGKAALIKKETRLHKRFEQQHWALDTLANNSEISADLLDRTFLWILKLFCFR
jgi:2-oxoisovalerate dehydrogenase E1 component